MPRSNSLQQSVCVFGEEQNVPVELLAVHDMPEQMVEVAVSKNSGHP